MPDGEEVARVARDVLDSLLEGCQVISPDLRYVYVNPVVAKQGKRTPESLLGRTMMECYPGIERTPMFAELRRAMMDREHGSMLNEFTFPDGSRGFFELRFVPVDAGVCILSIDVTAHRRALANLRESESALRAIFTGSPDATLLVTDDQTVFLANGAAATLFGRAEESSLVGERLETLLPGLAPGLPAPGVRTIPPRGQSARRASGRELPVAVSVEALTFFGKPSSIVVVRDLSEQQHLEATLRGVEEQARQMQKMEAVSRLAGGIAHDFNNMLSVILSYASLLKESLGGEDERAEDVEQIEIAAKRAAELTTQLLAFSRREVPASRASVVDDVIESMAKMLVRVLGPDVELVLRTASSPRSVDLAAGPLEQIVMNLAVNARDAMPTGGTLTIETKARELDEDFAVTHLGVEPGPHVELVVTDTGIGMDAATQARMFEPFFTTKEAGRGTGLGLSTVFGIVQQHLGTIWVDSALGRGTTFRIYLPAATLLPRPAPAPAPPPRELVGGEVVLVCDDEPQVRELVRDVLSRDGFVVLSASSPEHALEIAAEHRGTIELLVTDVVMPKTSGPRLAKRIAELRPDMRVLFMSGYTAEGSGASEIDADAAFLPKPITPDALLAKVAEVLGAGA